MRSSSVQKYKCPEPSVLLPKGIRDPSLSALTRRTTLRDMSRQPKLRLLALIGVVIMFLGGGLFALWSLQTQQMIVTTRSWTNGPWEPKTTGDDSEAVVERALERKGHLDYLKAHPQSQQDSALEWALENGWRVVDSKSERHAKSYGSYETITTYVVERSNWAALWND